MAQYFFHHHECGDLAKDGEGRECPDLHAAELHALKRAREIIAHEVMAHGELCLGCSVDVHDDQDRFLLRVPFRRAVLVTGL